jgi:hypothetical protein
MPANDREHIRLLMDTKVFVELTAPSPSSDGNGELVECGVIDVSYGGFRVSIPQEVTVGAILAICAELTAIDRPFYMAAEVMWCRQREDEDGEEDAERGWLAGFKLLSSSDTDVNAWRELLEHV